MQYLEITFLLLCFIIVLAVVWFFTRNYATIKTRAYQKKNMQLIEVLPIAFNQYLYIVKITDKYHLFCGTKERISYCTSLGDDIKLNETFEKHLKNFTINDKNEQQEERDE
ncbi:MAG: hypothetical protein BEN19_05980 [Epulopiscium sp. Nuni2H_MBin003]|nr:MAG: hypothetical protein BEN19_05980 [Epulopiscium sp. Nuni2H_MBin003]